jgi:hypothetical protein
MNKITFELIKDNYYLYDLDMAEDSELSPIEFIDQYRDKVRDKYGIILAVARKEFMSEKDLRLFGVWCVKEVLNMIENPDERCVKACDFAEKYANGRCSLDDLSHANLDVINAIKDPNDRVPFKIAMASASVSYWKDSDLHAWASAINAFLAASDAVGKNNRKAVMDAVTDAQLDKLRTYFVDKK